MHVLGGLRTRLAAERSVRPALSPSELRWTCHPEGYPSFGAEVTSTTDAPIGQARAVRALELGIRIDAPGYNMFVTGLPGSGRMHAIEQLLGRLPTPNRRREDRAYVHDFEAPSRPRLLRFPPGGAANFRSAVRRMLQGAREQIPLILEEESYLEKRRAITEEARSEQQKLARSFQDRLAEDGFRLVAVQEGSVGMQAIFPVVAGRPVPFEVLRQPGEAREQLKMERLRELREERATLPEGEREVQDLVDRRIEELEEKAEKHLHAFEAITETMRTLAKRTATALEELERATVRGAVEGLIRDVAREMGDPVDSSAGAALQRHLDGMLEHIMSHPWILAGEGKGSDAPVPSHELAPSLREAATIYGVNIVQEAGSEDAPVVVERHPSFTHLFGTIEREVHPNGTSVANYTHIQPGSILRADGGFLVMYARDVLIEPGVWRNLVRALSSGQLEIQRPDSALFLLPSAMKPEPLDLDVKVVLIGDEELYALLTYFERDFPKVFKVKAEFEPSVERGSESLTELADVARSLREQGGALPLAPEGLAALAEHAARLAEHQGRLSTRFGDLFDVVVEADHFARRREAASVDREAVLEAVESARERHRGLSDEIGRAMAEGVLLIDVTGARVGQINGLAVWGGGRHRFGKPTRITATVGAGRGGIVNIEREARLSGPVHDKGVLVLAGFLRERYGRRRPLALTASLAFEQSYGGIDGDSASLAELYALLSALSGRPIEQRVAVTGSVNQKGDIQAIGGVNEKVEGFFEVCKARGASGQGCLIPEANRRHLMLREEVVAAAEAERFSVWVIRTVDEGIPVVFGVEPDVLHREVADALAEMAEAAQAEPRVERVEAMGPRPADEPTPPRDPPPPGPPARDD